jgi:dethiobiotin synthetase
MNYLITGTDTGVGKTFVSCGLIRSIRASGIDCVGMKPVCTGEPSDVEALQLASDRAEADHLVNPIWLHTPLAPYTAAMIENRWIDIPALRGSFARLAAKHAMVIVEGAGGLLVPILPDYDFRNLARDFELGVIVVAANRLGALNHTRLTVEALRKAILPCSLVILNNVEPSANLAAQTNLSVLETLLDAPVIELAHQERDFSNVLERLEL